MSTVPVGFNAGQVSVWCICSVYRKIISARSMLM